MCGEGGQKIGMLNLPQMLLLGSAGSNSGRRAFACRIISRLRTGRPDAPAAPDEHAETAPPLIIGLKLSTIRRETGAYRIIELKSMPCGEDDADTVFLLEATADCLTAGMQALLSRIPEDSIIVCESNTLRSFVVPGVFLMLRHVESDEIDASAAAVMSEVDQIVLFDDRDFDLAEDRILFFAGGFHLRDNATLVLLAGGASKRMGTNKSLIDYKGTPLITHLHRALSPLFDETIISTNDRLPVTLENVRLIGDRPPGYGPIGGIVSSLEQAKNPRVFITACDIPTIHYDLIAKLMRESKNHEIVVSRSSEGYLEPLHAVYNRSVVPLVRSMIENNERRIRMVYDHVDTAYVALLPHQKMINLNTPSEYRRFTESGAGIPPAPVE